MKHKITPETIEKIYSDYNEGVTVKTTARALGITEAMVYNLRQMMAKEGFVFMKRQRQTHRESIRAALRRMEQTSRTLPVRNIAHYQYTKLK